MTMPGWPRLTEIELQAIIDALEFTEQHASLVSDAHGRAKEKVAQLLATLKR